MYWSFSILFVFSLHNRYLVSVALWMPLLSWNTFSQAPEAPSGNKYLRHLGLNWHGLIGNYSSKHFHQPFIYDAAQVYVGTKEKGVWYNRWHCTWLRTLPDKRCRRCGKALCIITGIHPRKAPPALSATTPSGLNEMRNETKPHPQIYYFQGCATTCVFFPMPHGSLPTRQC